MWENQETFKERQKTNCEHRQKAGVRISEGLRRLQSSQQSNTNRECAVVGCYMKKIDSLLIFFFLCQINLLSFHLSVCVEQLEQRYNQLLHADVSVPVLLHVVAHGLPLGLRQQVARLLLQHGPRLVHQAGKCHLGAGHAFIKSRLLSGGQEEKRTRWRGQFESFSSFECYLLSFYNNWFYIWFLGWWSERKWTITAKRWILGQGEEWQKL